VALNVTDREFEKNPVNKKIKKKQKTLDKNN